jgi:hypothetical protein
MPDEKKIFTMTVVSGDPNERDVEKRLRSRCWGYYFDQKEAEEAIEGNETDMSECGYYRYAVLTELGEGPCAIGDELQWYEFRWKWTEGESWPELLSVDKIDRPAQYEGIMFEI